MFRGKKYTESAQLIDRAVQYDPAEALSLVVKSASAKFDETVELHIKLGVDSRHADQQVRGAVVLPNGTGKTRRVLLCDFDPQANATSGMGIDKSLSLGIYDVLINGIEPEKRVISTRYADVLPSCKDLAGAGIEMIGLPNREFLLKNALQKLAPQYDYIFIDCPPSLELLTLNGLCAADSVLVPVQSEYFALEGLSDLMNTIRIIKRSLNPSMELEGVLLTMFDSRTNLAMQVAEEVKRYFPGKVYATVIPRNVRLSEAPSHGKPITAYDRSSRGYEAYTALAEEFLRKSR